MRRESCVIVKVQRNKETYFTSLTLNSRKYLIAPIVPLVVCVIIFNTSLTGKSGRLQY